jgi:hypothetical protein
LKTWFVDTKDIIISIKYTIEILLLCISECSVTPRIIGVLAFHARMHPPTPIREWVRWLGSGVGITIIAAGIVRVPAFLPLICTPSPILEID